MTRAADDRPDISRATDAAEESQRRAEAELRRVRDEAPRTLSLARLLRQLREENGFGQLMDDAFGGGRG